MRIETVKNNIKDLKIWVIETEEKLQKIKSQIHNMEDYVMDMEDQLLYQKYVVTVNMKYLKGDNNE